MKIVITGYSGFIGQRLVPRLLSGNHQLVFAGRRAPGGQSPGQFVRCDLADGTGLDSIQWNEVDAVIHLASAGVKSSHRFWPECLAVNIVGLQHLLSSVSTSSRVNRVIVTGTFYERIVETNPVLWDNPYVATKWTASQSLKAWAKHFKGNATLLHLFQIYGPGDDPGNVLTYIRTALQNNKVSKLGSGKSRRDWLHVDDAVSAILTALERPQEPSFSAYDVGSGELRSIREAAELLADNMMVSRELLDFDWKRDRHDVGIELVATNIMPEWTPSFSFSEGLKDLIKS